MLGLVQWSKFRSESKTSWVSRIRVLAVAEGKPEAVAVAILKSITNTDPELERGAYVKFSVLSRQ